MNVTKVSLTDLTFTISICLAGMLLHGATQTTSSDQSSSMILWPFDSKTTALPTTHKLTGAYTMWAGSPHAHVHIMGRP